MVKKLLNFSYSYPRFILFLVLVLTLSAAPFLSRLQFDISAQGLIAKSDDSWLAYQQSQKDFGGGATAIIVLSDDNLFSAPVLLEVKKTLAELNKLEFVNSSSSLFNVPNIREIEGYIESKPFLQDIPETPQQMSQVIDQALANHLVADNLVSPDRNTMSINLVIDDTSHYPGRDSEITRSIEKVLQPLKQHVQTVFQMSSPYVRDTISHQIQQDMETILPLALLVLIVVLGLSMGRLNCSIVPLSSSAVSIVLTLSFMAYMGISVNVLTSIIPALLIIIGSTEDVHLMAEYHIGIRNGLSRDEAVQQLPVNQSLAITLAFATTLMGFLSITISELELLFEFGWLVSVGLIINFMVTILLVPAYLRLFGGKMIDQLDEKTIYQRVAGKIFVVVIRFKKTTLLLLLMVAGYYGWGAQFLQVNNNTLSYFPAESEINQRAQTIHEKLSGMQTFSVILDSSIEGTFQRVRYLREIENVQEFIDSRGLFDKTLSFADFVKLTHQVMEGTSKPMLPLEDETVQVYMEFVQFDAVKSYVDQEFSKTRILVRHNIGSSNVLKKEFMAIENFIKNELKSNLKATLTGESVLNNNAADAMAAGQIQSLLIMMVVILLIVSMLFIDLRAGIIALVPNVFPIIILFGVMGYFGIPLDTGTTMVAVIALGVSVDDTIHFLSRYHFFTRGTDDVEKALKKTMEHEATPISTTSIALALGFSTLMLSSFQPVVYFGGLSALVMMLAMFSTFILTPILLSFTRLVTVWDMLSINLQADVLSNSQIFKGLKYFQIKKAILSGKIIDYKRNDVIVEQGVSGKEFFVLLEGAATASHREPDGSRHTVAYLKAGDLFGEVAQLSHHKRSTRVTANEKTQVLEMKWSSIKQLGRFHPRISMRLYRNLAAILSRRLAEISIEKSNAYDELTGALTKPYLCEILQQEIKRSHFFDEKVSLMLLNIEVEPIDEELSGELQDSVILAITRVIKGYMRESDIFARWDRCAFMMVLPHSDTAYAIKTAQDIQAEIESADICTRAHLYINATVSEMNQGEKREDVLGRMEEQLDKNKKTRKSLRITVA